MFVYKPEVTIVAVGKSVAGSTDRPFYSSTGTGENSAAKAEAQQQMIILPAHQKTMAKCLVSRTNDATDENKQQHGLECLDVC